MLDLGKLDQLKYVVNEAGERTDVIVPVAEFTELLEDLEDLAAVDERREEETITHDELIAELTRDGLLQD